MEEETSETSGNDGVTDQEVPVDPLSFDPVERGKVGTSVELLCGMLVENGGGRSRVKGHDRGGEKGTRWKLGVTTRLLVLSPQSDHFIFPTTATPLDLL